MESKITGTMGSDSLCGAKNPRRAVTQPSSPRCLSQGVCWDILSSLVNVRAIKECIMSLPYSPIFPFEQNSKYTLRRRAEGSVKRFPLTLQPVALLSAASAAIGAPGVGASSDAGGQTAPSEPTLWDAYSSTRGSVSRFSSRWRWRLAARSCSRTPASSRSCSPAGTDRGGRHLGSPR